MTIKPENNVYIFAVMAFTLLTAGLASAADMSAKDEVIVKNVWVDVPLSQVLRDISVENGVLIATCPHVSDPLVSLDAAKGKNLDECIDELTAGQGLFVKKKSSKFYLIVCGDSACPSTVETVTSDPIYLNYISSKHLRESLPRSLQQYVTSGQRDNEVLIYAVPEITDHIKDIIKKLDVPQEQVMLEVLVVDLREGTSDEFELNWDILGSRTSFGMARGVAGFTGLASYTSVAASHLFELNLTLRALIEEKKASIRSRPRVATINGEKAKIDISLDEYYTIITDLYGTSLRTELEVIKSGVSLEMTPHIGEDGFITVDVQTEVSDVASRRNASSGTHATSSSDLPVIRRRKADTHVRVREGDAIVIGGLIETQESESHGKFPLLGDMPVVGGLFKSKADTTEKKEVMIFITPQIMRDDQMAFSNRNTMINGVEEVNNLRSKDLFTITQKTENKKQKAEEIRSLNNAVTILDGKTNAEENKPNAADTDSPVTPEEEKQMLQEAINLLAADTQKYNGDKK